MRFYFSIRFAAILQLHKCSIIDFHVRMYSIIVHFQFLYIILS